MSFISDYSLFHLRHNSLVADSVVRRNPLLGQLFVSTECAIQLKVWSRNYALKLQIDFLLLTDRGTIGVYPNFPRPLKKNNGLNQYG